MNLSKFDEPFHIEDIEWRAQRSGETNGKPWCMVLAYVTNRAIMKRLDEVCGKDGWKNEYHAAPDGGVMCGISVFTNNQWVTKWDAAENTQIEAVKGGMSGAMKRAAVQWGVGRYLYQLEENFAQCETERPAGRDWVKAKTKSGLTFWWKAPTLPDWALPVKETNNNEAGDQSSDKTEVKEKQKDKKKNRTPEDYLFGFTEWALTCNDLSELKLTFNKLLKRLAKTPELASKAHEIYQVKMTELELAQ